MIPEHQPAKPKPDATGELTRAFETRAAVNPPPERMKKSLPAAEQQRALFSPEELTRLWSLDEVAEFLGTSKAWVRDHATRRQPRIACVRMGSRRALLRFRRQDVEQFINEHLQSAEGPFPKRS